MISLIPIYQQYFYTQSLHRKKIRELRDIKPQDAAKEKLSGNDVTADLTSKNCKSDIVVWSSPSCGDLVELLSPTVTSARCVPVKSYGTNNITQYVGNRYDTCPNNIYPQLENLVKYASGATTVLNSLIDDINSKFLVKLQQDNEPVFTIVKAAAELKSAIGDDLSQLAGKLKSQLNCTFLGEAYGRVHLGLCKAFVPTFSSLSVILALVCGAGFLYMFCVCCIIRRWQPDKTIPEDGADSQKNQT